jgi:hypothetical protein
VASIASRAEIKDAPARIENALHLSKIEHPSRAIAGNWPTTGACAKTTSSNACTRSATRGLGVSTSGPFLFMAIEPIVASRHGGGQLRRQVGPLRFPRF